MVIGPLRLDRMRKQTIRNAPEPEKIWDRLRHTTTLGRTGSGKAAMARELAKHYPDATVWPMPFERTEADRQRALEIMGRPPLPWIPTLPAHHIVYIDRKTERNPE